MLKLLKNMKGYGKECVLGPLLKLMEALIELFIPYVVLNMINNGIEKGDTSYIVWSSILLVGMGLVGLALSITAQYFSAKAAVGFTARVREKLFSHIQKLSYRDIDKLGKSTLINRLTSDMNQVQTGVNLALRLFLRSPFIVFGAAIMAFTVSPEASTVFLLAIPVLAVVVFAVLLITIPLYKKVQARLDVVTAKTRENLNGARMLRALVKEDDEISSFNEKNGELNKAQKFVGKISSLTNPLTFVIINIAIALLIYKGGLRVEIGLLSQAAVIALYNYMSQILVELIKLANMIITLTKTLACAKRVQSILDIQPSIVKREPNDDCSDSLVEFRDVAFKYSEGGDHALKNVSFKAEKGETVGIIGGTGSGKSTLINLLCRFYDTTNGTVYLKGNDVKGMSESEILSVIGIVPQKSELFAGTIKSNILFGNENATDEEIKEALDCAVASEFVNKLEKGIDSPVEQYGRNLSGGQKQRLTLARAIVKRPEILILDDSSSALDYLTDLKLRRNIASLDYKPAVFIVSQRFTTIKDADKILVLDEGEIVGIGKHDELYENNDLYREICESQTKNA
ncbi:MAG: ABC transporter ATP-binding protein [Ruminococcaceae bacterium]|nr:ABC transporter ATP-binding protein [Oscillospiraceae bacterium]